METQTIWGTIAGDGSILSGIGFRVIREDAGTYLISFDKSFIGVPSIVGSQTGFGDNQNTKDNIVFPFLGEDSARAFTGNSNGDRSNRQFSFIAMGAVE